MDKRPISLAKLRKVPSQFSWVDQRRVRERMVDPENAVAGRPARHDRHAHRPALRDAANPFSILTKGSLILRDLDLLRHCAEVASVATNVSVGFVDRALWRSLEPGTPSPQTRLQVCRRLVEADAPVRYVAARRQGGDLHVEVDAAGRCNLDLLGADRMVVRGGSAATIGVAGSRGSAPVGTGAPATEASPLLKGS